ncbi:hypothetical protein [Micromonospora chalcea]|uniref:hypothetical protein n=1 Tax=Micromonospora chalcea TaxID=1874 RepID=UPI003D7585CD
MPKTKHEQTWVIAQTIHPYGEMPPSVHYLIEFMMGRALSPGEASLHQRLCASDLATQHPEVADRRYARTTDDPTEWMRDLSDRFGPSLKVEARH